MHNSVQFEEYPRIVPKAFEVSVHGYLCSLNLWKQCVSRHIAKKVNLMTFVAQTNSKIYHLALGTTQGERVNYKEQMQ